MARQVAAQRPLQRAAVALGVLAALGLAGGAAWRTAAHEPAVATALVTTPPPASGPAAVAAAPGDAPASGPAPAAEEAARLDRWVAEHSVLRGTALDGGWGQDAQGRVRPSRALRQRFDHVLQLAGQVPTARITDWLTRRAQAELAPQDVATVLQVWQAYLALLAAPGRAGALATGSWAAPTATGWAAALAERRQLRRQWLGAAWADAFYAEEEAALARHVAAMPAAPAEPAPLIDRSSLSAEAAQRLAEEEAAQARWQQRLAEAAAELQRLRAAPELSPPQREAALQRLVAERFEPGTEQSRARALLGLAPG